MWDFNVIFILIIGIISLLWRYIQWFPLTFFIKLVKFPTFLLICKTFNLYRFNTMQVLIGRMSHVVVKTHCGMTFPELVAGPSTRPNLSYRKGYDLPSYRYLHHSYHLYSHNCDISHGWPSIRVWVTYPYIFVLLLSMSDIIIALLSML